MPQEVEPNHSFALADPLVPGVASVGRLSIPWDVDIYRLDLSAPGVLTLALDVPTSAWLDFFALGLYDAGGELLSRCETGSDLTWQTGVAAAGNHFVVIEAASFHTTEAYALTVGHAAGPAAGVESEPNGTLATADALTLGTAMSAQLMTDRDLDVFRFEADAPGIVTLALDVWVDSLLDDFMLGLYDAAGRLMSLHQTGSDATWQVGVAAAGSYFVAVEAASFHSDDPYRLTVSHAAGSIAGFESEPNGTFSAADPIVADGAIAGQLSGHDDIDIFRFTAATAGLLTVDFDAPAESEYFDYFHIAVFDAQGTELGSAGAGSDLVFQSRVASPGDIFVQVGSGDIFFDPGQYRLKLALTAGAEADFEQEPNDDLANPLASGSAKFGRISNWDDVDWYRLDTAAAADLAIAFDSPVENEVLEHFNIWVFDELGNLLASRAVFGDTGFTVAAPVPGGHFIAVTAGFYAHDARQYALTATATASTIARESETNDSNATADVLAVGDSIRGQLSWLGDDDRYVVTLASGGKLAIEFDGPTDSTYANYFHLEVQDALGVTLATRDTGGDVAFEVEAAATGTYFLSVSAAGHLHSDGEYRLSAGASLDDGIPSGAIVGTPGADRIQGTTGADLVYGAGGHDQIDGGDGTDTVLFRTHADNLSVNAIGGITAIRGNYAAGEHAFTVSRVWNVEKIRTWSGTENLGAAGATPVFGTSQSEVVSGTAGNDLIDPLGGSDLVEGGAGHDTLALFGAREQFVVQTVAGITRIQGGDAAHEYAGHTITAIGIETLAFNQSQTRALETNDINKIFGVPVADVLAGTTGDDIVDGRGGNDVVDGGTGQDTLAFFGRHDDFVIDFPSAARDQLIVTGKAGTIQAGQTVAATNVEMLAFLDRNVAVANPPKVVMAPATTLLAEGGGGAAVQVSLAAAPSSVVTVVFDGGDQLFPAVPSLAFGPANWNVPQALTVLAIDDVADERTHGGTLRATTIAADGPYSNLPASGLAFTISDNDAPTTGSVGGRLWHDLNRNKILDPAETSLANWTVFDDANRNGRLDSGEAEARTDASGAYRLDGLAPGPHAIVARVAPGWVPTFPTASDASATIVTNQATAGAVTTAGTLDLQSGGPPTYANLGTATNIAAFRADPRFAGIDGAGYSVVVIDTGIDLDHPHFGPDGDGDGIADRIVFQYDFFGANDASAADGAGHGTHVAGIVASGDATYPGVAPGANLIVLKVFPDGSGAASYGDIVEAANWVVANARQYNVVAVNLSLGSQEFHAAPVAGPLSSQFKALSNSGVVVVSASGNSYAGNQGVAYPSADPYSLSVGAVWPRGGTYGNRQTGTTDAIAVFSQRDDTESDIFAPGVFIDAAYLGGGHAVLSGTSMASPQVAGMIALAQQLSERELGRRLNFDEVRSLLKSTGDAIVDGDDENDNVANTGLTFHRIDMLAMAEAILGMKQFLPVSHAVEVVAGATVANRDFGFAAAQSVQGLSGDDLIVGSAYGEALRGGPGADWIDAGDGDDEIFGEAGDDVLAGGRGDDLVDGGAGIDTVEYAHAGGPVTAVLGADGGGSASGADGADRFAGIENLRGGSFADTLTGNAGDNVLSGGRGDDMLDGGAGDDRLDGGDGADSALYPLVRSAYDIRLEPTGALTLRALSGSSGTDTLSGVEMIRFADRVVAAAFTLSVEAPPGITAEGDGEDTAFVFSITRAGDISGVSSAVWSVTGNGPNPASATDFAAGFLPSGTITFAAGETARPIVVTVAGDGAIEADEAFALTLSAPSPGTILAAASAIATIVNDDSVSDTQLSVGGPASPVAEGDQGAATVVFQVARSGDASRPASGVWSVAGSGSDPASAGDFVGNALPHGTISFAAGETSKTVAVNIAGDTTIEPDEGFTLTLSGATGATLGTASASATIRNDDVDDRAPKLQANGARFNAAGTQVTLTFDEVLAAGGVTPGGFAVNADGQVIAVTGVTLAGGTATLSLGGAVASGAGSVVAYADPAGDQTSDVLQDVAGNDVASFSVGATWAAAPFGISGMAYHWKNRALLPDVSVTAAGDGRPAGATSPIEIRGLGFDANGDARFEVWANAGAAVSSLAFDLRVGGAAPVSWTPGAALDGWTLSVRPSPGRLDLDATGPATLSGAVALGTATIDLAPGAGMTEVEVSTAQLGGAQAPRFATQATRQTTPGDGRYSLSDLSEDVYALSLRRGTADSGDSIDAADALAALKIAVGRNPNHDPDGVGPDQPALVTPYQFIGADVNGDGSVDAQDALGILKMVVRRPDAPAQDWIFVREDEDFWDEAQGRVTLDAGNVTYDRQAVVADLAVAQGKNFVAVLKGDVDGSWTPGGSGIETLDAAYFASLSARLQVPVEIWG
jgi:Ca2+-binding RTX toxin-like protein